MPDEKLHIEYSFEDIQRYLNSGMNADEMRALEKAALNDPFLADAIEGYAALQGITADKHLNEINAAILGEHAEAKIIPLSRKKFYWWRIAAMILVLAGAGILSLFLINNNSVQQNHLVANTESKGKTGGNSIQLKDSSFPNASDTIAIAQNYTPVQQKKIVELKPMIGERNKQEKPQEISAPESQFSFSNDDSLGTEKIDFAYTPGVVANDAISLKKADTLKAALHLEKALQGRVAGLSYNKTNNQAFNFFNGQIADNNNLPIPNAVIIADKKQATVTDKNGNFKLIAPDSILNVMVSSVGFNSVNTSLNTNSQNLITLTPQANSVSEVVVTGYGVQRKAKRSSADSAYPVGGWQSFLQYMDTTLNRDVDSLDAEYSLDVQGSDYVVEFLIDAKGNPYSFRIPKGINPALSSKIIEMLKEGPRWIPAQKNNKAKLKIPR